MQRMQSADTLCAGLPALLDAAGSALADARPLGLGVVLSVESGPGPTDVEGPGQALFVYVDAFGSTAYLAGAEDLPAAFRPRASERVVIDPDELGKNPEGLVESRLLHTGLAEEYTRPRRLGQIVTLPIEGQPPSILVAGLATAQGLSASDTSRLERLGAEMRQQLSREETVSQELLRLRRLDSADRLLPALFNVLDVRQIFDRLSEITKDIVRHDFASVGLFNERLNEMSLFARTSTLSRREFSGPMPYPVSPTRRWLCRFVRDLQAHPVDGTRDFAALDGGRCSIRLAIRYDDRPIGALNFTSRDPSPYTALDMTIARRVADYVALAVSHQRLAEEGRRAAALEERNAKAEGRVKTRTDELDSGSGFRRMAGESKAWERRHHRGDQGGRHRRDGLAPRRVGHWQRSCRAILASGVAARRGP